MLQSKSVERGRADPIVHEPSPRALAELVDQVNRVVHGLGFIGGLNPAQWAALRHLCRADESARTVGGLAVIQGVTAPTASETVSALVRKGYVERMPSRSDKRSHTLALTSVGRSLLEVDPLREVASALERLTDARRRALAEDLDRLLADLVERRARRRAS
jgi:DNA-binding MarR family transcriptional regulator